MKRFWKNAAALPPGTGAHADGWQIALDGRPVRTPAKAPLLVPAHTMADAIAAEWNAQGEDVNPAAMPVTGFANAAIDQITPDVPRFVAGVAAYGETDLLCYRAPSPVELIARQGAEWDPLLDWARTRYDIAFRLASGILHVAQPPETVARLAAAVAACDPFLLAGLSTLVTLSGSLVIGLSVVERAFDVDRLWRASELDSLWQAELWGEDDQAAALRALRRSEFDGAAAFCRMALR